MKEYIDSAASTGAFNKEELQCLEEVLNDWNKDPGKDYMLISSLEDGMISGFLVYGKTPMTDHSYDLYWIVVSPAHQRKGIGHRLVKKMEEDILRSSSKGIIRIETSGRYAYDGQRQFYLSLGYREKGRIQDFYSDGDDLVTYSKTIKSGKTRRNFIFHEEIPNCSE